MARYKLPDEVKILRGTAQPCRMSGKVQALCPATPEFLEAYNNPLLTTDFAKQFFVNKCNYLLKLGMLDITYLDDLATLAVYVDERNVAIESIKEVKFTPMHNEKGNIIGYIPNPNIKYARDLTLMINEINAKFGFTPVDRLKLNSVAAPAAQPAETPRSKLLKKLKKNGNEL